MLAGLQVERGCRNSLEACNRKEVGERLEAGRRSLPGSVLPNTAEARTGPGTLNTQINFLQYVAANVFCSFLYRRDTTYHMCTKYVSGLLIRPLVKLGHS